jgi:glycosyltransferase involved in cell wall biosynthesis
VLRCRPIRPAGIEDRPDTPLYLVGFFSRISGVGTIARRLREDYAAAGRRVVSIDLGPILDHGQPLPGAGTDLAPAAARKRADFAGRGTILVVMDAPYSPFPLLLLGARFRRGKSCIALWFWELAEMPPSWRWSAVCFDEIRTCSTFNRDAARAVADRVRLTPLPLAEPLPRTRRFAEDRLRVLFLFNMSANFARKNPLAVIEAFVRAFGSDAKTELVLKVTDGEEFPDGLTRLRAAAVSQPNVVLVEESLAEEAIRDLYARSDVYLSLHRAEGLGEPLLEAIRHGLHVVATGWSGNLDFMQGRERCYLVPCSLVPVVDPQGVYPSTAHWAEPSVPDAAALLRRIAESERPEIFTGLWKSP